MEKNSKKCVDFNINLAQVFDSDNVDKGFALIDYASSVNISCDISSGCPVAIKNAVQHCKFNSKEIGALISLPNTNKSPLELSEEEIESIVLYQLGAISAFTDAYSLNIEHVRPFGLMYKLASENLAFSTSIANAVKKFSKWLTLYGAAGEILKETEAAANINIAQEVFFDKKYTESSLIDFSGDVNFSESELKDRLHRLIENSEVIISENNFAKVEFDTIHFDVENSLELIKEANNVVVPRSVNYNKVVASGWVE